MVNKYSNLRINIRLSQKKVILIGANIFGSRLNI